MVDKRTGAGHALLLTATITLSCFHPASAATPPQRSAAQLLAVIVKADKADPNSPAALDARLEYADFLLDQTQGACAARLDLAQSQLDAVAANPATQVMFPDGWDRAAQLEYRIDRDRAACDRDPQARPRELQATLEAAQRAVRIYRSRFDYASMALAQFNVAASYQAQGKAAEAIAALEAAIAMDRDFGLSYDAQDNYATWLMWRNQPAGPDQVAQLMRDFPNRSTLLEFAWTASDASVTVNRTNVGVIDRKLMRSEGSRVLQRQVHAQEDGWTVSYTAPGSQTDFAVWPSGTFADGPPGIFRPMLLQFPGFAVTAGGDFKAPDLAGFATQVTTAAQTDIRKHAPAGAQAHGLLNSAVRAAQLDFAPEVISQDVSQNYELETGMWIGATLQQGVHYQLIAPLSLAGIPYVTLNHQLDFVFARELPCPNVAATHPCVELIVRATPLGQPLHEEFATKQAGAREVLQYSASMLMRVITDPQTLQPYLRDTRRYWYVTLSRATSGEIDLQSDRSVISATYLPP